jgi:hypothetical protein
MNTNWRIIRDFPNHMVSDTGDVMNIKKNTLLSVRYDDKGYKRVNLYNSNVEHSKFVHRLIADAFIPNPRNLPFVDHIDRVRDNNDISNLRWVTRQENAFNTKCKGVYFDKNAKKFRARIGVDKKRINLGIYDTEDEARSAYLAAKQTLHIIGHVAPPQKIVVNVTLKNQRSSSLSS